MYLVSAFVNDKCRDDVSIIERTTWKLPQSRYKMKKKYVSGRSASSACLIWIKAIFWLIVKHSGHDVTSFEITRTITVYYSFVCKEIHDNMRIWIYTGTTSKRYFSREKIAQTYCIWNV